MKPQEKRLLQIELSALREAQKAQQRHPEQPVTREELRSMRVQTVTIGERLVLASAGVLSIAIGAYTLHDDSLWWLGIVLILIGCIVLVFGAIGWRRTLDALDNPVFEIVSEFVLRGLD